MCSEGVSGFITALAMVRCRVSRFIRNSSTGQGSYGAGQNALSKEAIRFEGFVVNFAEGGNAVVPFEKSCCVAYALNSAVVELPDRIDHRMIVGIENIFFVLGMAGDVDLRDALGRNAVDVVEGIEAVILR